MKANPLSLRRLMAWVGANCHYLGEEGFVPDALPAFAPGDLPGVTIPHLAHFNPHPGAKQSSSVV